MRLRVALAGDLHQAAQRSGPQEAGSLAGLGKAGGQPAPGMHRDAVLFPPPCGPQQGRNGILLQRSSSGKGIAGQAEHQLFSHLCSDHGAAGLLGHPGKNRLRVQHFQHCGQIILLPHRNTAAGDDGITPGEQVLHPGGDLLRVIRAVGALHGKAQLPQAGGILDPVGIVDLAGSPGLTRFQQLTAGGKHAHGQGAEDLGIRDALTGQHTDVRRGQHSSGSGNGGTDCDVLAPEHHIGVGLEPGVNAHLLLPAVGQLLHQNAVRARGQGCTGHNAGSTPGRQGSGGGIPGVELHHHRQGDRGLLPRPGRVGTVKGIAIQRAPVKRGLIHPGAQVPGCDPPTGIIQRHPLRGRHRESRSSIQHPAQGLGWRAKRLFHCKNPPSLPGAQFARYGPDKLPGRSLFDRQVKKSGDVLTENQNAPAKNRTWPGTAACRPPRRGSRLLFRCCSSGKEATLRNGGWEEFFFSNCSVSSAGRRPGFPCHP